MASSRAPAVGKGCLVALCAFSVLIFGLVVAAGAWVLFVLLVRATQAILMHWSWWPLPILIGGGWLGLSAAGTAVLWLLKRRKRTWLVSHAPAAPTMTRRR